MKKASFGFALGVLCTFVFGVVAASFDSVRSYTVIDTNDHEVHLKSEEGAVIVVRLENVPDVSPFEIGSSWEVEY